MSADYRQQQELQEYEQWLADDQAQVEYQQHLLKLELQHEKELKHEQLERYELRPTGT